MQAPLVGRFSQRVGFLVLVALATLCTTSRPASAVTRQQAINHVASTIIDTTGTKPILRAYALQAPISPSTPIAQNVVDTLGTSPAFSTWFIWIDLNPNVLFAHPTQFVMVNSVGPVIHTTVVIDGDLWPTIQGVTYYSTEAERNISPDLFWDHGVLLPKPGEVRSPQEGDPRQEFGQRFREFQLRMESRRALAPSGTGTWGLIVNTLDSTHAGGLADVACAMETFDSLGVTAVTTALHQTKAQTLASIDALPNDCAKLYVFWVGHGKPDSLVFSGEKPLSAHELACKLKEQGADEYCLIMTTCFSGSFLDDFEDKGLKGFHVTSTSDSAYTSSFRNRPGAATPFNGAPYAHYLWDCLQNGLRGVDAHQWSDSLVQALRDSLVNSADSLRWRANWGGKYKNDDDPQGGYVHTFGAGGIGSSGAGEPFTFKVARGCSTVCMRFPGTLGSDICGNFTLSCEVQEPSGKKWVKSTTYNWNLGKTIYFRTYGLPNATGEYKITMHSNRGGVTVGVRWLAGTTTPVTPTNSYIFNAHAVGWLDASSLEFNTNLGMGGGGGHTFSWFDGATYTNVPANQGPNWFNQVQFALPLNPDPDRPFLYNNGDPALGYMENTLLVLQAAALFDPETQLPAPITNYQVQAFQPMSGNFYGPFAGTIESPPGNGTMTVASVPSAVMLDLGTIYPEPLIISVTILGPGVVAWDAMLLVPESAILTDVPPPARPYTLALRQNEPNPFNPRTTIRYELARTGAVQLAIFDVRGRLIRTLVDARQVEGPHAILWDGRANTNEPASTGIYFYRLVTQDGTEVRKMTLLR